MQTGYDQLTHEHSGPADTATFAAHLERRDKFRAIYVKALAYLQNRCKDHENKYGRPIKGHRSWLSSVKLAKAIGTNTDDLSSALNTQRQTILRRCGESTANNNTLAIEYRLCDSFGGEEHQQISKRQIKTQSERLAARLVGCVDTTKVI